MTEDLNGKMRLDWRAEGLPYEIVVPMQCRAPASSFQGRPPSVCSQQFTGMLIEGVHAALETH